MPKNKTDQKAEGQETGDSGKTKQERPVGSGSVGSHKPGGDGRGNKKIHKEHDVRKPRP